MSKRWNDFKKVFLSNVHERAGSKHEDDCEAFFHLKFYNTSYVYILRYFLITLQTIQTLQG